ncbi:MAG: LysM peptidoglycan-binding domain-containing protein [bacterium]
MLPKKRLVKHEQKSDDEVAKRFYIVRSGDWLSRIAQKFYGDPMRYPELFAANRNVIENPDRIFPGQKLVIPRAEEQYYTVRSGDWLSRIAQKFYGDPMRYPELFAANRNVIKNPDRIFPGQRIRLVILAENDVVRKNDWLSKIAERVDKDAHKYQQIVKANEESIADPDRIYPGQKQQIPKVREPDPPQ